MIYESYPYYEALESYVKKYWTVDLGGLSEDQQEHFLLWTRKRYI